MGNLRERLIRFARVRYAMGQTNFEKFTGMPIGTIHNIRDGFSTRQLERIMDKCPELNIEWLITGKGQMLRPSDEYVDGEKAIPLLPFDAVAGTLLDNITGEYPEAVPSIPFTNGRADFAIRVDGDSMYPRYHSGDVLLVRKINDPSFFQWGKCYVLATTQGCVVKRLYPDRDNAEYVVCHSENSDLYPDYHVKREDIIGVGLVVGHIGLD